MPVWTKFKDDKGKPYFFNNVTKKVQWNRPADFQEEELSGDMRRHVKRGPWDRYYDKKAERVYYVHKETKKPQWTEPDDWNNYKDEPTGSSKRKSGTKQQLFQPPASGDDHSPASGAGAATASPPPASASSAPRPPSFHGGGRDAAPAAAVASDRGAGGGAGSNAAASRGLSINASQSNIDTGTMAPSQIIQRFRAVSHTGATPSAPQPRAPPPAVLSQSASTSPTHMHESTAAAAASSSSLSSPKPRVKMDLNKHGDRPRSRSKKKHQPRPPNSSPPRSPGAHSRRRGKRDQSSEPGRAADRSRSPRQGRSPRRAPVDFNSQKHGTRERAQTSHPSQGGSQRHMPRPPAHPPSFNHLQAPNTDADMINSESELTSDPDYDESDGSSVASPSLTGKRGVASGLPPLSGLPLPPTASSVQPTAQQQQHQHQPPPKIKMHHHQRHPSTDGTYRPPMHDAPARPMSRSVGRRSIDGVGARSGGLPLPGGLPFPVHRTSNASPRASVSQDPSDASSMSPVAASSSNNGAGGKLTNRRPPGAFHHKHPSQDHSNVNFASLSQQPRRSMPARNAPDQQSAMLAVSARPKRHQKLVAASERWDNRNKAGGSGGGKLAGIGRVMTVSQRLNGGGGGGGGLPTLDEQETSATAGSSGGGNPNVAVGAGAFEERRGRSVSAAVHNLSQALNHIPMRTPGIGSPAGSPLTNGSDAAGGPPRLDKKLSSATLADPDQLLAWGLTPALGVKQNGGGLPFPPGFRGPGGPGGGENLGLRTMLRREGKDDDSSSLGSGSHSKSGEGKKRRHTSKDGRKSAPSSERGSPRSSRSKKQHSKSLKKRGGRRKESVMPKGVDHVIDATLKTEIHQFKISSFAEAHFAKFKKRGLFRKQKKIPMTDLLKYQSTPLENPLLDHKSGKNDAKNNFKNILTFMDPTVKKNKGNIASNMQALGLNKPSLRDEIFCQLCKQTTENPDVESDVFGWKLIMICLSAWAPTRSFEVHLRDFLQFHSMLGQRPPRCQVLAGYCDWLLSRHLHSKSTFDEKPLTLARVDAILDQGLDPLQISFGSSISFILKCQEWRGDENPVPEILRVLSSAVLDLGGETREGIFRIAGETSLKGDLKRFLEGGGRKAPSHFPPEVPADLMKSWIRDLSFPLIPFQFYDDMVKRAQTDSPEECVQFARSIIPPPHIATIDHILKFVRELIKHEKVTAMGMGNMCIVFTPNIVQAGPNYDLAASLNSADKARLFMEKLIVGWPDDLF